MDMVLITLGMAWYILENGIMTKWMEKASKQSTLIAKKNWKDSRDRVEKAYKQGSKDDNKGKELSLALFFLQSLIINFILS